MWNLRKQDMEIIKALRQDAMEIVFKLYDKYHLDEYDRLTEATANMFSLCISEPDVNKRIRLLEEHRNDFGMLAEYYYYLGMGYLESGQYIKAKSCFDTYSDVYAKTPLFRCDEKGGTIALARLSYEKNLSQIEKKHLINIVLQNLPNNSAALLQCAMIYLYELEDETQCLNLLRKGLDNPYATDRELLLMTAVELMPVMTRHNDVNGLVHKYLSAGTIGFDTYVAYLIQSSDYVGALSTLICVEDVKKRPILGSVLGWPAVRLHIVLPERFIYERGDIAAVYWETHKAKKILIRELQIKEEGITLKEIEKVSCFDQYKDLKYLFFETLVPNEIFVLKRGIDYNEIEQGEWPRMSQFVLSGRDIKQIVKFCKKHEPENRDTDLFCKSKRKIGWKNLGEIDGVKFKFKGSSCDYVPSHAKDQRGEYLRVVLFDGSHLLYRYDKKNKTLQFCSRIEAEMLTDK